VKEVSARKENIELALAWSPDGRQLAVGGADGTVALWDTESGAKNTISSGFRGAVCSLSWDPRGKRLAGIASWSRHVLIWDTTTRSEEKRLPTSRAVGRAVWSPDGQSLAVADNHRIQFWDVESEKELPSLSGHAGIVMSLAFSPDGDALASVATDGTVKIWNLTNESVRRLPGHKTMVFSVAWSPDGTALATGGYDGAVNVWSVGQEPGPLTLDDCGGFVAWSPDGRRLASRGTSDAGGRLKIFDAGTGETELELPSSGEAAGASLRSIDWSPSGGWIATGSADGTVSVWAVEQAQRVFRTRVHAATTPPASEELHRHCVVAWNHDEQQERLASGGIDGNVRIWDVKARRELASYEGGAPIISVAWSPDGQLVASASLDQTVQVWDIAAKKLRRLRLAAGFLHTQEPRSVSFSPDGKRLAAGSIEGSIIVWEVATGDVLFRMQGHASLANTVAWSPDGSRLVSGGEDHTLKIYDMFMGKELVVLHGHTTTVRDLAWSPDGRRLASASRTVKIWNASRVDENPDEH
jgi:WD40 repeat protein